MIGRAEQVDVVHGISSTYACENFTPDSFYDAGLDPGTYGNSIAIGNWQQFFVWERDRDFESGMPGDPYDISSNMTWTSGNSSVVAVPYSDFGEADGVGEGTNLVYADGESILWNYAAFGEESNPDPHPIPINLWAEVTVYCAHPTNFRVGRSSDPSPANVGFVGSDPDNTFTMKTVYFWDSSAGIPTGQVLE